MFDEYAGPDNSYVRVSFALQSWLKIALIKNYQSKMEKNDWTHYREQYF